jgi:rubrerythrin
MINYSVCSGARGLNAPRPDTFSAPLADVFSARVCGRHKKDVLVLLVGERGAGKSYTLLYLALRCAEEIAKRKGGSAQDYFTMKNVAVIQDADLEERMRNLTKFNVYILDDAGVGWDSRAFATSMNRRLNHILQTCRTDNCILLISVIDPFTIDKVPRTMVRYYGEIAEQLHDHGMNLVKVFRNKRLFREGKNITPHLRFGRRETVKRWISYAPPPEIADEYDRVREENANKVKAQLATACVMPDAQSPEQAIKRQLSKVVACNHCGYEYTPRKKNPRLCPVCKKKASFSIVGGGTKPKGITQAMEGT